MSARSFNAPEYKYGFNGKEKDDETSVGGGSYDFGARIYDSRLGRWLSLDPLMTKYPSLSPYNFSENNPVFFNDPDGRDAIGKINGNTITISATIYIANEGKVKINAVEAQKNITQYWGKDFKYTDEAGKTYNVKFDITVKEVSPVKSENPVNAGINFVRPEGENYRSSVSQGWYGRWATNQKDKTYAHEVGHMLGLADQYVDVEYNAVGLDFGGNNGTIESWDYASTAKDELMGATNDVKVGDEKVSQRDVNAIASFVLKTQKNGEAVINSKTLLANKQADGLAKPTIDDKVKMEEKVQANYREVVEPHSAKK
jgi:RHS repeat-associated protein